MKIAIIGSHSTGKTTLINELKKYINLPVITEVARDFPRDITGNAEKEMDRQVDIFESQMFMESKYNSFMSDRSTVDNAAYMSLSLDKYWEDITATQHIYVYRKILEALKHGDTYDYLFYIPIEFKAVDDGFRCMDEYERNEIDYIITQTMPETIEITGSVSERVHKVIKAITK